MSADYEFTARQKNIEGDYSRANKCKVRMISSEMYFAPTSNLRECLNQIRQARQTTFTAMNPQAKPSEFGKLSFDHQLSIRWCQSQRGLNTIQKKFEKKPSLPML